MPYKFNPLPWRFDRVGDGGGPSADVETLTGNSGGAVGVDANQNINVLGDSASGIDVVGNPGNNTLTIFNTFASTRFPITPYVVGPVGQAGYQTVQAAIDAANAAGGGGVWVQQGQYIEDLTLYDQIYILGVPLISQGVNEGVEIRGTHTPPAAGHVQFNGIFLSSLTSIFSSAAAGTTHIQTANCETAPNNGYVFDLPNWSGILEIYDCNPGPPGAPWAINDGGVNNTGGASVIAYNTGVGNGSNLMTISGDCFFGQAVSVGCPLQMVSGTNITSISSLFNGSVTLNDNSIMASYNDGFAPFSGIPLTYNSSSDSDFFSPILQSPTTTAVSGNGTGECNLYSPVTPEGQQIGPSVITPNLNYTLTGTAQTVDVGTADLITYELRDVNATYQFIAQLAGISLTGGACGVRLIGNIKTNGSFSTVVDTVDQIINNDLVVAGASATVVAVGNSLVVRATGSLGAVINWNCNLTFQQITL